VVTPAIQQLLKRKNSILETRQMKEKILRKDFVSAPETHITHFHIDAFDGDIDLLASPRAVSKLAASRAVKPKSALRATTPMKDKKTK
jgi:hypothetical protein